MILPSARPSRHRSRPRRRLRFACAFVLPWFGAPVAIADEASEPLTLILGVGALPDYLGSDDYRAVPFVLSSFTLREVDVDVEGPEARLDVVPGGRWRAGPLVGASLARDDSVDSAAVGALESVDAALELGAWIGFERSAGTLPEGTLSGFVSARRVVSGEDDGARARARLQYFFAALRWLRLVVDLEANAADGEWTSRRFDVDTAGGEASSLPRFDAGGGARDVGVGAGAIVSFSPSLGLYGRLGYSRLLGDAADSPVTRVEGDEDQWFAGLGVLYSRR